MGHEAKGKTEDGAKTRKARRLPPLKTVLLTLVKVGVAGGLLAGLVFLLLVIFLPLPSAPVPQSTEVYDLKGRPVSSLFVQNRVVVPSSDIPKTLKDATVAAEDMRFYQHHGIDFEALVRALVTDIRELRFAEGGSTITMQLARNLFLTLEKTIPRKFLEMVYTLKLEMRYTKDEILTMYLNQIYMGHGTWGVEVASEAYFGTPVKDLDLAQSALLAAVLRSPEYYSPYNDMKAAVGRRDLVLGLMTDQGYISAAERDAARNEEIVLAGLPKSVAPYFVSYVISQIQGRHPDIGDQIYKAGYKIYTTLDLDMQEAAEDAFAAYMPKGAKDTQGITQPQGALVAVEPSTGYVKAMIGGRNWEETQLNRAYQVKRQPGSAMKIFLYAAVIDLRHPVTETMVCEPVTYPGAAPGEVYRPVDFGTHPYHYAPLTIRQAVTISDNVIATKWAAAIGPDAIVTYARKMGIKTPLDPTIPLALGASEVVPIEMTVAAATLSAGGIRPEPLSVLKVVDAKGQVIEENRTRRSTAIDAGTAYVLTSVLRSVLGPYGTGAGLSGWLGGRPAAGKTGTTDDQLEAWFVGYTKDLACSVYVGWDNREKSLPGTGAAVAGPIWADFMGTALQNVPISDWTMPANVTWAQVCDDSNLLAGPGCPSQHAEVFLKNAIPAMDSSPASRHPQTGSVTPPIVAESGTLERVPLIKPEQSIPPERPALVSPPAATPEIPFPLPGLDDFLRRLKPRGSP